MVLFAFQNCALTISFSRIIQNGMVCIYIFQYTGFETNGFIPKLVFTFPHNTFIEDRFVLQAGQGLHDLQNKNGIEEVFVEHVKKDFHRSGANI